MLSSTLLGFPSLQVKPCSRLLRSIIDFNGRARKGLVKRTEVGIAVGMVIQVCTWAHRGEGCKVSGQLVGYVRAIAWPGGGALANHLDTPASSIDWGHSFDPAGLRGQHNGDGRAKCWGTFLGKRRVRGQQLLLQLITITTSTAFARCPLAWFQ